MLNWIKKQTVASWAVLASAVLGLAGVIIFLVTSTTGYLKGLPMNSVPVICTFVAIAIAAAVLVFAGKIDDRLIDLAVLVIDGLLIASLMLFVLERITLIADVYFIPVNYPPAEEVSLNISIVGFVFYALSIVAAIVSAFVRKFVKD